MTGKSDLHEEVIRVVRTPCRRSHVNFNGELQSVEVFVEMNTTGAVIGRYYSQR